MRLIHPPLNPRRSWHRLDTPRGRTDQPPTWGSTLVRKRASTGYGATAAAHIACTLPPRIPPRCTKYLHGSLVHHTRGKIDPLPGKRQRAMNPPHSVPRSRDNHGEKHQGVGRSGALFLQSNPRGLPSSSNPNRTSQRWCRRPAPPSTLGFLYPDVMRLLAPNQHLSAPPAPAHRGL